MSDPTTGERHGRECAAGITNGAARCQCATPDAGAASERDDFCVCNAPGPAMPGDAHEWACSLLWQRVLSHEAAAATRARAEAWDEAASLIEAEARRERERLGPDCDKAGLLGNWIGAFCESAKMLRARADSLTPDTPARTIPTTATVRAGLAADTAADNKVRWNRALKGGA